MARQCTVCGKKSILAWSISKLRGKYNRTIKKRKYPNLQKTLIPKEMKKKGFSALAGKRVMMCSTCRRTIQKEK